MLNESYAYFLDRIRLSNAMLIALAFVPTADIESAFDDLVATLPSEATTVVNYFEDNNIGRPSRRGQRCRALFPITF